MTPTWLAYALLVAAALHIVEEFAFPGGFVAWYRDLRPEFAASITPRYLAMVNVLLLILCYDAGAARGTSLGVWIWLATAALLAANGIWHLAAVMRTRRYSPGVATGMALYVPIAVYGYARYAGAGRPLWKAAVACALGASYQLWSDRLHRRRARSAAAR